MRIGYARVSATHQNLDRQLAMLKAAGCKRVFKEKKSGREGLSRPELEKAIQALGSGDVLILAEWDRATRSMLDGIRIIERVAARGASLKALDRQWLDLTTPVGKGILAFLSALAEDERVRILARANGGRAEAKKERGEAWPQAEARTASGAGSCSHDPCRRPQSARGRPPLPRRAFHDRAGSGTNGCIYLTPLRPRANSTEGLRREERRTQDVKAFWQHGSRCGRCVCREGSCHGRPSGDVEEGCPTSRREKCQNCSLRK